MANINLRFEKALGSDSPTDALVALAKALFKEGYFADEVNSLFEAKQREHKNDSDKWKYDAIVETRDLIAGRNLPKSTSQAESALPPTEEGGQRLNTRRMILLLISLVVLGFVAYSGLFLDCFRVKIGVPLLCRKERPVAFWGALGTIAVFALLLLKEAISQARKNGALR